MYKKIAAILTCLLIFTISGVSVSASDNTTYTYTRSINNDWIRTQNAYMPGTVYLKGEGLSVPNDIFIHQGLIYVADTGNFRVIILNPKDNSRRYLGEGILISPEGIFVTDDGTIYVADGGENAVFIFNQAGELISEIRRPVSSNFSEESVFQPRNVVVSPQGYIYVAGTGSFEGIMQFTSEGKFTGYFAANKRPISILERIQDLIFTEEQSEQLLTRKPNPVENISLSDKGLIYAVTRSDETTRSGGTVNSIKLCNMAGVNLFAGKSMVSEANFVDIAAGANHNFFALTYTGVINEYDENGDLLFSFGGRATTEDRSGMFSKASAIDVDENGFVYVLDSERGFIQVFYPTEFASSMHQAIYELNNGNYRQGEDVWQSVLRLNGMSKIAHIGYGKTLLFQHDFKGAMEHFKIANEKGYYSETMWELRNEWLNKAIPWILGTLMLWFAVSFAVKRFRKKKVSATVMYSRNVLKRDDKTFGKDILFIFDMMRHPIDGFYYLKRGQRGSVFSASVLYAALFAVFMLDRLLRGFIFNATDIVNTPVMSIIISFFLPMLLWVLMSYMISSINDGEGSLKNIYIATAYSLSPYLLISPVITALTYVLTINEAFLISFGWNIAVIWSGVLLVTGVKETQNYKLKTTIKNIVLTILLIILAVVTCIILYLMLSQLISFLESVFGEASYRAMQ